MPAHTARRRLISNLVGAVIVAALVYAAFRFFWFDARPGDRVPLHGTAWTITQIDGLRTVGPVSMSFEAAADFGHIESTCFRFDFEYSRDTDGDSIEFFDFQNVSSTCQGEQADELDKLRSALDRVLVWRAPEADRIELQDAGETVMTAVRAVAT
jgi:hypothetical protein